MGRTEYKSLPDMSKARRRVDKPELIRSEVKVAPIVAEFAKGRKYMVKTFGCQANVRDEEIMAGYLEIAGFTKAETEEEADIVIINTCAIRENAEDKVYGEIGKFKAHHLRDKNFILGICGCMMQEEGVAKTIKSRYSYVNLIFGTHNISNLLSLLGEHLARKKDLVDIVSFSGDIVENLPSSRLDNIKAYVNITYGCDKFCTYCIVPYTRGRERSRAKEDILNECRELVEQGYQEITLLGQNVNSYGKDFKDGTSFASILREVAELGIPRLRFMTSHPWDFSDEMLDVIASHDNIMKCIHLPVQSGSTEVLRLMGRRYSREEYLALVKKIRDRMPECAITTDIIVGFPNETAEQFEDTLTLCQEVQYDAAFTFIYSPRKGTPAAAIVDNVSDADKHERFDRLLKVIESSVTAHSAAMVGKEYKVLVDGPSKKDPNLLSGYTETGKLVHFRGPSYLKGQIVNVRIEEDHAFSMIGVLLDDPLILLAKKAKAALLKEKACLAYFEAKKALEEDASLKELANKKEEAQKKMMRCIAEMKDEEYEQAKKEFEESSSLLASHPVMKNFENAQAEFQNLLLSLKDILA